MLLRNPSREKLTGEREKNSKWGFSTRLSHLDMAFASIYTRERRRVFIIVNVNIRTDRNDNV